MRMRKACVTLVVVPGESIDVTMEPMIIEVHGVPHIPPHDRMIDQLKIHFLKRKNCGGDVLTVIYPTSTPGQAYVIFESAKVHGVLEHTHFLDVHNKFYPIRVKKAHLPEKKDIEAIEKDYGTEMTLKDDDGLMTVKFRGKNSEKAKECLLNIIKEISPSLRTQVINLLEYDQAEQKQILERIQHNQETSVVIKHCGDVIKLVGSSSESFEMKQKLLGHKVDHPRGRTIERGSKLRRSSSLPTQYKTTHHACRTDPEHTASAAPKYNPSRYEEKPDEGKAPQIVRVHELTPDKNSQRTRSNSESRSKNRTTREKS
ncbi:hypothetical protein QTP70_034022, partial [Hemibagrus guttatus]